MKARSKRLNFTLVELLVTIAVIIIISVASMPAYSSLVRGRKLDSSTYSIHAAVMEARTHAVATKSYTALIFYPDANSNGDGVRYRVAEVANGSDDTASQFKFMYWAEGLEEHSLPEGIKIPFKSPKDFGLADKPDDTEGSQNPPDIKRVDGNGVVIPNEISSGKQIRSVVFKPNGQLAGTDERYVVIRLTEAKRFDASANDAPRVPININWLTGMAVTKEAVLPNHN